MRYLAALTLVAFASLYPCQSQAAPANDKITNATALSSTQTLNRVKNGDITGITNDGLTFAFSEYGILTNPYPDLWFKWTAPMAGTVSIQTVATNFVVWGVTVEGPAVQDVYPVVGYSLLSTSYGRNVWTTNYTFKPEAGKTYYNGLLTWDITSPNAYTYVQTFTQDPLSDDFATRTQLGGTDFKISGNNSTFTQETGEPDHAASASTSTDHSAWMTWRSPDARKSVVLQVKSKLFKPIIAIYTGDALDTLKLAARSTPSSDSEGFVATASFVAEDGVDYHFAVDGSDQKSGAFTLELNASTVRPGFVTSPTATTVEQGTTAIFTAAAAYTGDSVSYQWQRLPVGTKKWVTLGDDSIFGGTQTSALSIFTSLDMNKDLYRVLATDSVGTSSSRSAMLTVTEFPAVNTEILGTVSTNISSGTVPVPTNGGVYYATGLPKGLSIDPETGAITGVVNAKPGTYRVLYGSTDGKKKNPQVFVLQIIVAPLSSYFSGSFEALLDSPDAQTIPQGKVSLKVAANGQFTGSYLVLAESKTYPFRGALTLNQVTRIASAPVDIARGKPRAPLHLALSLAEPLSETQTATVVSAAISDENDTLLALASDGAAVSRFTATNLAPWAGRYTLRLADGTLITDGSSGIVPPVPIGSGYATGMITDKTGVLSLRGYLADNTLFTASLASSPDATYRAAQRIYGPGGSLAGRINLVEQLAADFSTLAYHSDLAASSSLYWAKPARPKDKLYPAGFGSGAVRTNVLMEPWANPAGNFPSSLGLASAGDMKVKIAAAVTQDGNDSTTYGLPVDVRLSAAGSLSFVSPASNDSKFAIKIDPVTGVFTGSYELAEVNPARGVKPRKVTFSGVMAQHATTFEGDVIGEGFAIVPPFSADEKTTAASIKFLAGPPESPFGIPQNL